MNVEEVLGAFSLVNNPIVLSEEEVKDVQKAIKQLQQENEQLKDNWNKLKEYCLDEQIPEEYDEYNSYIGFSNSVYDNILNKMQELEKGSENCG